MQRLLLIDATRHGSRVVAVGDRGYIVLSDDEGKTWKWKRHLERTEGGSFHYPSLIQTRDCMIHVTYSHFLSNLKTIKHARFNVAWVQQGDQPQN
jgi:predicted neuraminidase